ncbi:MAG: NmrA family NAD(P)-binding protein [Chitinophagaceae bacterium]|nr:NmrA family NAD(P)-binding protein [Chitinophagaceae bacterium]
MPQKILVAGATGNLGGKIINALLQKDVQVFALVRPTSSSEKIQQLKEKGVTVLQVNMDDITELANACKGMSCIVSAMAGLKDVIMDAQKKLLDAAVAAGVPRFIASDYSIDFTNLVPGKNRNLDMRREFHSYAQNKPITLTTIFNGAFMELLTGDMPLILFKRKWILYWGSALQPMDFTTTYNVASFTANAAVDATAPRYLHIAGSRMSSKEIGEVTSAVTGKNFKLFKAGGLGFLELMIKLTKLFSPGKQELYPPWQGMQYMRDMLQGRAIKDVNDNNCYPEVYAVCNYGINFAISIPLLKQQYT